MVRCQRYSMFYLYLLNSRPNKGDFVDRGEFGPEVLLTLYALRQAYPGWVYLIRGNHVRFIAAVFYCSSPSSQLIYYWL